MGNLFEAFSEKFEENIKHNKRLKDAFAETNQQMGFVAYKSYNSYSTVRKKKKKNR